MPGRREFGDTIELAHDPWAGKRGIHHQAEAFPGEVIDQSEDAEAPATHQRVSHEVERPAQIPILRDRHGCPGAESSLAATTLAHRQPFLLVKPVELLGVSLMPWRSSIRPRRR